MRATRWLLAAASRIARVAALSSTLQGITGCNGEPRKCEVRVTAAALTNAAAHAEYLKLEPSQEAAVVQLRVAGAPLCSGALINAHTILTAKHCISASEISSLTISFGTSEETESFETEAQVRAEHELDVAVLELDAPAPDYVVGLAVARALPSELSEGSLVQLAGFGYDHRQIGERGFLVAQIVELSVNEIAVSADGLAGACFGDSGGPLIVRGDDGNARVLGLLTQGPATCRGTDRYTRLDVISGWLDREAEGGTDEVEDVAAESLGEEGRCFGSTAAWFDAFGLHGEACRAPLRCGWSGSAAGYRCVPREEDPCRGVSDLGECEEGTAVRCVHGQLERNPCDSCGFECTRSPKTGAPVCLSLPGASDGG